MQTIMWLVRGQIAGEASRVFPLRGEAQIWAERLEADGIEPVLKRLPDERTWRQSPGVNAALKERPAWDVLVVCCDRCGGQSYYNQGSHATCEWCGVGLDDLLGEDCRGIDVLSVDDLMEAEIFAEDLPGAGEGVTG